MDGGQRSSRILGRGEGRGRGEGGGGGLKYVDLTKRVTVLPQT